MRITCVSIHVIISLERLYFLLIIFLLYIIISLTARAISETTMINI